MKQLSLSTNRMIEKPWDYVGLTLPNGGYLEDEKEVLAYASSIGHDEFVDFNDEDVIPNNIDWVLEEGIFTVKDVMNNRVHSLTSIVPRNIQNEVKEGDIIRVINPNDDNDWVFCVVTFVSRPNRIHIKGKTFITPFQMGILLVKSEEVDGKIEYYV